MMNTEKYQDSLKGFGTGAKNGSSGINGGGGDSSFEAWKKFVLGQAGGSDGALPFSYKDPSHTQTAPPPGTRSGWLEFPAWASSGLGFGAGETGSSSWWETLGMTRTQRYVAFGICMAGAAVLFMLSMVALPLAMFKPSKFAAPYCLASLFVFISFGFLHGFVSYLRHLFSRERFAYTALFFGTTLLTLYSAMSNLGYIVTVLSILAQLVCLVVYVLSYVPGGQSGISLMSTVVGSSIRSRFTGN